MKPIFGRHNVQIWPNGKKWVLVSTHDTDAVTLSNHYELCVNAIKAITRMDGNRLNMFIDGCDIFKVLKKILCLALIAGRMRAQIKNRGAFFCSAELGLS